MYSRRVDKRIDTIPESTMQSLQRHPWPGNVRELQNFIERAVILSTGSILHAPLEDLKISADSQPEPVVTLRRVESSHIMKILRETNWVLGGPRGAAIRLGLKRTTLVSKMHKLGLTRLAPGMAL